MGVLTCGAVRFWNRTLERKWILINRMCESVLLVSLRFIKREPFSRTHLVSRLNRYFRYPISI